MCETMCGRILANMSVFERARRALRLKTAPAPVEMAPAGVGLALGGGFARGFAHLGVFQVLEENGIRVTHIAGSSIGSLLGAAYAAGEPVERIAAEGRRIRFRDFGRWTLSRLGLASNERLGELVRRSFPVQTFEELKIPTAVVATDLGTGEPFVITSGRLDEAIRASCAFPGLFEPVQAGERWLADGGLVAPVPAQAARELGAGLVIGVSVGFNLWNGDAPTNLFQVVNRAVSAAQKNQGAAWRGYADLVIEPEVHGIDWDHFHRVDEAVAAGAAAMRAALPRLTELLSKATAGRCGNGRATDSLASRASQEKPGAQGAA